MPRTRTDKEQVSQTKAEILQLLGEILSQQKELAEAAWLEAAAAKELAEEKRRERVATERRAAAVEQVLADIGLYLGENQQLNKLVGTLLTQLPLSSAVLELAREAQRGYDRLYAIQKLILQALNTVVSQVEIGDDEERKRMVDRINNLVNNQETLESLEEQLRRLVQRRNLVREQLALYGVAGAPTEKLLDEERLSDQIEEITEEIRKYGDNFRS